MQTTLRAISLAPPSIRSSPRTIALPLGSTSLRAAVWSVIVGIALVLPVLDVIALLPQSHRDPAATEAAARRMQAYSVSPWPLVLKALIIFPILEEIFYRGLLMPFLRRHSRPWIAVGLPTLLFAATHLGAGVGNALFALMAGSFFAWLVLRSRSLVPSMLCHSATNLSVLFIMGPIINAGASSASVGLTEALPLALTACSVLLLAFGLPILVHEFARHQTASNA